MPLAIALERPPEDRQPLSRVECEPRNRHQRRLLNWRRQDVFNREGRAVSLNAGTCVLAVVASAWASVGLAQAPSTELILFGRVDVGLVAIDDGTRNNARVDSGRYTESRWGLRGTEHLGAGWAAIFYLESGYSADTATLNQGGRLFGRGAYAGLRSDRWGQVTLGRQYVPLFWPLLFADDTGRLRLHTFSATQTIERGNVVRMAQSASPISGGGSLDNSSGGIYTIGATSSFEDNQIVYQSPSFGGATAMLSYGTGAEIVSTNSIAANDQRVLGANVEWRPDSFKGLYLGAAWNEKSGQRVIGTASYEQKLTESALTGQYVFPSGFSVWGNYHPFELASGPQRLKGSDYMVGLSYRVPSGMLWGNHSAKRVSDCVSCGAKGYGIGYQYHLSNRTELYAFYSRVDNDANSAIGIGGVEPSAPGKDPSGYGFGIATQF
jgi:predicted porin